MSCALATFHGSDAGRMAACPIWAREHLDTEDIVQDTLLRSVRQLDAFTPKHETRIQRLRLRSASQPAA